jgi:hypothetical protein
LHDGVTLIPALPRGLWRGDDGILFPEISQNDVRGLPRAKMTGKSIFPNGKCSWKPGADTKTRFIELTVAIDRIGELTNESRQ